MFSIPGLNRVMQKGFFLFLTCWVTLYCANSPLLRGTMDVDQNGHLQIGGCDVSTLSALSPYPIYVVDESLLRSNMQAYVASVNTFYPNECLVYYATKAMMNLTICKIAASEGLGLDVSSGGELYTAIQAQFPLERVIFHGNNKSEEELRMALENGVGKIAIDNLDEARLISRLAQELDIVSEVILRVKPGVHADTHHYIVTGTEDSKFGFNISDGSAKQAIQEITTLPGLQFRGIHCHIGSQILSLEGFEKAIEVIAAFCQGLEEQGITIEELNFGGGLGAQYTENDHPVAITTYIETVAKKIASEFGAKGLTLPKLMLEPGRSIVAEAGTTLYKIGSTKQMPNSYLYAAVNGGMGDNIRPALYGAKYTAVLANRANEEVTTKVKVVGKCCESGDILIHEILLPKPEFGDILAVFTTGAYNYAMASNYNRLPVPGVLLVNGGGYDWIVIPQDFEDIIRNDRIPHRLIVPNGNDSRIN